MAQCPIRCKIAVPPRRRGIRRRITDEEREHRRRRLRRRGRRAYIRSVYSLPSLATLGNAICGFRAIYVSAMTPATGTNDPWTAFFINHHFLAAAYLIFAAMLFDAIDGRLARFTRHTTDFGGQLDSLADMVSFGIAPAFLAIQLFRTFMQEYHPDLPLVISRAVWAIGALYMSCAAIRLARFNVSNEHGEQHHFSFLGLPSPGACQRNRGFRTHAAGPDRTGRQIRLATPSRDVWRLRDLRLDPPPFGPRGWVADGQQHPLSAFSQPLHARPPLNRAPLMSLMLILLVISAHRYVLGLGTLVYAFSGPGSWIMVRIRRRNLKPATAATAKSTTS